MTLREVHNTELDAWIADHHYLHSTPAGAVLRLEFLEDGRRIGAMMWGRPTARQSGQQELLQLTRMYFIDDTEPCVESRALAMARKYIRKHLPQIKGLITFASTGEGHKGTIYRADGWFCVGTTRETATGWANRPGRMARDNSQKIKFCRTP
ncbi:MAG: hypothetical protein DBY27_03100 [Clostridiaceae bacterium]|nr:MAG: hypothetical protein DBY27_03100 [Clostridiaceae bacterium]